MRYSFIATEGIQDVAFISKILKNLGFDRERYKKKFIDSQDSEEAGTQSSKQIFLNKFWYGLVPSTFPADGDGIFTEGVPLPWFWRGEQICVAVQNFRGMNSIITGLEENFSKISLADLFSVGFVLDADTNEQPANRFASFRQKIKEQIPDIPVLPNALGVIVGDAPKVGAFIFPDNANVGTLEDLLLECADETYPNIKKHVGAFIDKEDEWLIDLDKEERKEYDKPAGKRKLAVAGISSVMKPGRNIQNSIEDCRWLCDKTMAKNRVRRFVDFLKELLDLQ
jgi:hypothetical protein